MTDVKIFDPRIQDRSVKRCDSQLQPKIKNHFRKKKHIILTNKWSCLVKYYVSYQN